MQTSVTGNADDAALRIVARVGKQLRVAAPVAIGKPVNLLNALYRLAEADNSISLEIFSGLTLMRPRLNGDLERRYGGPIIEAMFKDYPELVHMRMMREGRLPANVKVHEFFLQAGAWLNNPSMQQEFVSLGYASVSRHLQRSGINVFMQLLAPDPAGGVKLSLSCNADLALDLADHVDALRAGGQPVLVAGEINANLPFMTGEAVIERTMFDVLLDAPPPHFPLLAVPREAVPLPHFAAALHTATLIKDGGTLQIGIGSFADALTHALILRHTRNDEFKAMLAALGAPPAEEAETAPFEGGLYACSEMLVDGFITLKRAGILKRRVPVVDRTGQPTGAQALMHAGFFFGHKGLYEALRAMPPAERDEIRMTGISFPNTLFGQEAAKRAQRPHARFVNSGMIATLLGAVSSDQLADGRVVSGVGGQHDFAALAQQLDGARSIIAIHATRTSGGRTSSNIVWSYANTTLPRHLRDVVVTEYGIADVRGANDRDTIAAMLNVADAAFQPGLRQEAIRAGKLPQGWRLDPGRPVNSADRILAALGPFRAQGLLPAFPFGTELSEAEQRLVEPLDRLKAAGPLALARYALRGLSGANEVPGEGAALARLDLAKPAGLKARVMRALVLGSLRS